LTLEPWILVGMIRAGWHGSEEVGVEGFVCYLHLQPSLSRLPSAFSYCRAENGVFFSFPPIVKALLKGT
jgi:hypothetical protein